MAAPAVIPPVLPGVAAPVPPPPPHAASAVPNNSTVTIPMIPRLPVILFPSLYPRVCPANPVGWLTSPATTRSEAIPDAGESRVRGRRPHIPAKNGNGVPGDGKDRPGPLVPDGRADGVTIHALF